MNEHTTKRKSTKQYKLRYTLSTNFSVLRGNHDYETLTFLLPTVPKYMHVIF